ncbi:APC family permease [Candidatus Woesearchaeota archaeon]|nr:APC family permease [Candidatus Woesearchaeota archaeon]
MVGGGIFAVLGLAVQLSRGGTPIGFFIAGIVALITSYSYARLSVRYPSRGGTVEFLNQAFGTGLITGGLNILLWLSYIVMLSLYAYAFGSYGMSLFPESYQTLLLKHVLISFVVLTLMGLNIFGSNVVGRFEEWIVGFKVSILIIFIAVGIWTVQGNNLQPSSWSSPLWLVTGGMIIFLAYEGFELIANTAGEVKDIQKTLPRAYYSSIIFVIALYVLVSIVTVGNLSVDRIVASRDYALAVSAEPFLGSKGFTLITIAALLSTGSAINATFYGASRVSYIIAKDGELPELLEHKVWNRPMEGLLITAALTLFVANYFDISHIAMMGSAGFLIIFACVNMANAKLHRETKSHQWLAILAAIICFAALGALIFQRIMTSPRDLWVLGILIFIAFSCEALYRGVTGRKIKPSLQ